MWQIFSKTNIQAIKQKIEPLQGILLFLLALFAADLLWKLLISGDDSSREVLLCGLWDISAPFDMTACHITNATRSALQFLGVPFSFHSGNDIAFSAHHGISIVWGCTAIKQSFIFLSIMLIARGKQLRKLWYIPLGLLAIYLFNLFRIIFIALITSQKPEYFVLLHEYILKYLFYGFIFLIWIFWEEKAGRINKNIQ